MKRVRVGASFLFVLVAYALLVWSSAWQQSITCDEVLHLGAGHSYLTTGKIAQNPEHPPLVKLLAALPLQVMGVKTPDPGATAYAVDLLRLNQPGLEPMVAWARFPLTLLAGLLVAVVGLWAFELYGVFPALVAMVAAGAGPEVLSHGRWITTDLPVSAFGFLATYLAWKWLTRPSASKAVALGLAIGATLGSKFSGLLVIPMVGILIACRGASGRTMPDWATWRSGLSIASLVAYLVLAVCYFTPLWPAAYVYGASTVNANHGDFARYLLGNFQNSNFPLYFPIAYVLKTPAPLLLLTLLGIGTLAWRVASPAGERWDGAFFLACAALVFAFMAWKADDIGVRYVLPATPFLAMLAGRAARLWGPGSRIPITALLGWAVIEAFAAWNNLGGTFNRFLPGPATAYLKDSNLDWGQGLIALREQMRRRGIERIRLGGPFYDFIYDPALYGIRYDRVSADERGMLEPGWYAFSPEFLVGAHGFMWLAYQKRVAEPGGLWLYYLGPGATAAADRIYREEIARWPFPALVMHRDAFKAGAAEATEAAVPN